MILEDMTDAEMQDRNVDPSDEGSRNALTDAGSGMQVDSAVSRDPGSVIPESSQLCSPQVATQILLSDQISSRPSYLCSNRRKTKIIMLIISRF